jgi:prepilin peptidase CpaA
MWLALSVMLTIFALAGAISDARTKRISNRLVLGGIAAAVILRAGLGWGAVYDGLAAGLVALAIGLPLFVLRAFGAGDVKFMAMCGFFIGLPLIGRAALWSGAAGGILAAYVILRRRLPVLAAWRIWDLLRLAATFGRTGGRMKVDEEGALTAPFGVAIAAGCLLVWFGTAGGWIP